MNSSDNYLILTWDSNKQHILHADTCSTPGEAEDWAYARMGEHMDDASTIITYRIQPNENAPDHFIATSQLVHHKLAQS